MSFFAPPFTLTSLFLNMQCWLLGQWFCRRLLYSLSWFVLLLSLAIMLVTDDVKVITGLGHSLVIFRYHPANIFQLIILWQGGVTVKIHLYFNFQIQCLNNFKESYIWHLHFIHHKKTRNFIWLKSPYAKSLSNSI